MIAADTSLEELVGESARQRCTPCQAKNNYKKKKKSVVTEVNILAWSLLRLKPDFSLPRIHVQVCAGSGSLARRLGLAEDHPIARRKGQPSLPSHSNRNGGSGPPCLGGSRNRNCNRRCVKRNQVQRSY